MRRALACIVIALLWFGAPALAVQPDEILKDPVLEARARTLSQELRCMVCQNQSIDDSDAPLAKDLRVLVRERGIPYASFDGADHYGGDGDHWTPKGHELVADRLMALFSQNGMIAPRQ